MAADQAVVVQPVSGEVGVRPDARLVLQKTAATGSGSGGGTQVEVRWQLATADGPWPFAAGAAALLWDLLLRADDGQVVGDDWCEVHGSLVPLPRGTVIWVSCTWRNAAGDSAPWAAGVSFTTASDMTAARWLKGH